MTKLTENTFRPTYEALMAGLPHAMTSKAKTITPTYHCLTCHRSYEVEVAFVNPIVYPDDPPCPHCAEARRMAANR